MYIDIYISNKLVNQPGGDMTEGIRMINNAMEKKCEAAVKAIDLSFLKSKAIEKENHR